MSGCLVGGFLEYEPGLIKEYILELHELLFLLVPDDGPQPDDYLHLVVGVGWGILAGALGD